MAEIIVPGRPQPVPKPSLLRQLHNRVVGVRHHDGEMVKEVSVLTTAMVYGIDQGLLDEAFSLKHSSVAKRRGIAKLFLQLLGAVDYAGKQNRPVMLVGRKRASGFALKMVVPIDTSRKPGEVPDDGVSDGVTRES